MITALSRTALLKLSNSARQDLEFEFQKGGSPVLIGKGGFGEVETATSVTSLIHGASSQCPLQHDNIIVLTLDRELTV